MKKQILVLSLFLVGIISKSFAQNMEYEFKNGLRLNPIALGDSEFQIQYERYFDNRKSSMVLRPSIFHKDSDREKITGQQLQVQYRYYLAHYNKENGNIWGFYNYGFYAGLYAQAMNFDHNYRTHRHGNSFERIYSNFDRNIKAVEGGTTLGIQIDFNKRITLDGYIGAGVRKSYRTDSIDENPEYFDSFSNESVLNNAYNGIKPAGGLSLGITF